MHASFTNASQCVSVCECARLFACLPGIPDERRISSVPLIRMKGSTAARIKTSFSHFVTLSCKMSLLKKCSRTLITFQRWDFTFSWLSASRKWCVDEGEPLHYLFRHNSEIKSFNQTERSNSSECHVTYPLGPGSNCAGCNKTLSFSGRCWGAPTGFSGI